MGSCQGVCKGDHSSNEEVNQMTNLSQHSSSLKRFKKFIPQIIKIQSVFRGHITRRKLFRKQQIHLKKQRSLGQKHSSSTDDPQFLRKGQHEEFKFFGSKDKISMTYLEQQKSLQIQDHRAKSNSLKEYGDETSQQSPNKIQLDQVIEDFPIREHSFSMRMGDIGLFLPKSGKDLVRIGCLVRERLGKIQFQGGGWYEGEWLKSKPDGVGRYQFCDGSYYDGQWVNGMANGEGEFVDVGGDKYRGQWQRSSISGRGIYEYKNGNRYDGEWLNGLQNGNGQEYFIDGSMYDGLYVDGLKCGLGRMVFVDGSSYEGQFQNDEMHGMGIYRWKDGREYNGSWSQSQMHGKGVLSWPNGKQYCGGYRYDKRDGYGSFDFADGRKYLGQWKGGVQHGEGEYKNLNGTTTKGIWKGGKLVQKL